MKYVSLNTDYQMPVIGLGTWKSEKEKVYQAVRWAIKAGYEMIDCAAIYGNEDVVGQAVKDAVNEGDIKRNKLFVTSKLWNTAHKPEDVRPALEKTLADLQVDYLDLYLVHWPIAQDPISGDVADIPQEATWAEMEKAKKDGLVRSIGVSNFTQKKLQDLIEKSEIIPAVNQVEMHPFLIQNDLLEFCNKNRIVITAYAPLGSGDRPENMKSEHEPALLTHDVIVQIAQRNKITPAQVLIAWGLARGVVEIPKSIVFERIQENLAALNVKLDEKDMAEITALDKGFRYISGAGLAGGARIFED